MGRGQGFTIPINMAKEVAAKLLASGTIERGWLGVAIQPLNRDYASYFGSSDLEGILVSDIEENSPAQQAGIKPGDIILKFKDNEVSAEKNEDLNPFKLLISQSPVGQEVPLKIFRDNKIADFTVKIGIQPKVKAEEFETGLGFTVKEITDQIFRQYMLESKEGVLVSYVEVGSPASTAELDGGDVIKKVENKSIKNLDDFKKRLSELKDSKRIMLTIKRGKSYRFILILTEDSAKKQAQTEKS